MIQLNEKIAKAHQDSIEYIHDLGKKSLENLQSFSQDHYDSTKNLIAKSIEHGVVNLKDSKDMLQTYKVKTIHDVAANWAAYQVHLASVLSKNQQEIVAIADSAIDKANKNLHESVDSTVAKASKNSEELAQSFQSLLESSIQSYDMLRSKINYTYTNLGRAFNCAIDSYNQGIKNKSGK